MAVDCCDNYGSGALINAKAVRPARVTLPASVQDRLRFWKRGGLMALSVKEHYERMIMTTGEDIPVSRHYVPYIKEAGLLVRT